MESSQYLALLRHARSAGWSDPSVDLTRLKQQLEDASAQEGHTAPPDAERFAALFFESPEGREYLRLTRVDGAQALARDAALFSPDMAALSAEDRIFLEEAEVFLKGLEGDGGIAYFAQIVEAWRQMEGTVFFRSFAFRYFYNDLAARMGRRGHATWGEALSTRVRGWQSVGMPVMDLGNLFGKFLDRFENPTKNRGLVDKRVLMVDDQESILNSVRPFLEMWGMEIIATTDLDEALRRLREEDFDLLITDLVMPKFDGVTLLNKLIEANRFIPTLVLSGSQGNRQAAIMHDDLGNGEYRKLNLPLSYMKKAEADFGRRLKDRLLYLAEKPRFHYTGIAEEALPQLQSVLEKDAVLLAGNGADLPADERRRKMIERFIDIYLDARFAYLVWARPVINEIGAFARTLPDSERIKEHLLDLEGAWNDYPFATRVDILTFDRKGWHNFKGEPLGLRNWASNADDFLQENESCPPHLKQAAKELTDRGTALVQMVWDIAELRKIGREAVEKDAFESIRFTAQWHGERLKSRVEGFETDIPEEKLSVRVSEGLFRDLVENLVTNAIQATRSGNPPPILRARVVEVGDPFSAMEVKPLASDAIGESHRPSEEERRKLSRQYLFISVVNHGEPIPDEARREMLTTDRFTTKQFGTGLGLTFVREHMREVNGWMEVQSRDGKTEVAVFVPIDGRIVTEEPPQGGPEGSPTSQSGTPSPAMSSPQRAEVGGGDPVSGSFAGTAISGKSASSSITGFPLQGVTRGGNDNHGRSPVRLVGGSDSLVHGGVTLVGSVPPAEEEEKGVARSKHTPRPNRFLPPGVPVRSAVVPLRTVPVGR